VSSLTTRFLNWRRSPRRWEARYLLSGLRALVRRPATADRAPQAVDGLLVPAIESEYVEILQDPAFQRSVAQVRDSTCLDVARLANLWQLARLAGPGIVLEVGSYRGGTALHLCNALDDRDTRFYCFDPFEKGGFEHLGRQDAAFGPADFTDARLESVVALLSSKPRATVVQGYFPAAAQDLDLHDIAFCHLDVDVYAATKASLDYLAPRLARRGMIVLDDVGHRETPGVALALSEFLARNPSFLSLPLFPCQAVLLPKPLW
jgi:O-methyltransferase